MAAGTWNLLSQARRRLAEEEGTLYKQGKLKVALCSPTTYHVGMSSLGFQTIYREIHLHPTATAERAFLPDDTYEYRKGRIPVVTYETETPISGFPFVAFSIAYEL